MRVKIANLQRSRAELAPKIGEQVYLAFEYDDAAREFQISQKWQNVTALGYKRWK